MTLCARRGCPLTEDDVLMHPNGGTASARGRSTTP
jgi:hypothetical protein